MLKETSELLKEFYGLDEETFKDQVINIISMAQDM